MNTDTELTLAQRIEEAQQRLWRVVGEIEVSEAEIDNLKDSLKEVRRQADFLYERYNERLELLNGLQAQAAQKEVEETMRADILQLIVDRSDEELVKLIDLHQRRLDGGALTQNGILVHTKILAAEREELSNRAIKRELENE